jgi:hypothetical protein
MLKDATKDRLIEVLREDSEKLADYIDSLPENEQEDAADWLTSMFFSETEEEDS